MTFEEMKELLFRETMDAEPRNFCALYDFIIDAGLEPEFDEWRENHQGR